MRVLALDTALDACAAAVIDGDRVLAAREEPMLRGQQERLGPLVREVMAEAGLAFDALDRVGVTVGPGSFTGLRVGLAFAKGLGFALIRPVVGIGTLEALAASAGAGRVVAAVDARRGQIWLQVFDDSAPLMAPDALEPGVAAARLAELVGTAPCTLIGSAAPMLAGVLPAATLAARPSPDPAALARLCMSAREPISPPRPLYLRAPDAKLPGGGVPATG